MEQPLSRDLWEQNPSMWDCLATGVANHGAKKLGKSRLREKCGSCVSSGHREE